MDDALDAVLAWETQQYEEGYAEGWAAGLPEATAEGTKMGAEAGCVGGLRLGYIEGYVRVVAQLQPALRLSERAVRSLEAVRGILDEAAAMPAPTEDVLDRLEAKFATLTLQIGVRPTGVATATLLPAAAGTPSAELCF